MEKNDCREKIIELVMELEDEEILRLIYHFVNAAYKEEKAGT